MDNEQQGDNNDTPDNQAPSAVTAKIISIAAAAKERNAQQHSEQLAQQQLELPIEELLPVESGPSKYPTLLTRVPLFSPVANRTTLDTDWIIGDVYTTPWGAIQRIGPGLDIYDEDTLIGMKNPAARFYGQRANPKRNQQNDDIAEGGERTVKSHLEMCQVIHAFKQRSLPNLPNKIEQKSVD